MDHREPRLIADRVEAPDLRDVHAVLCGQAARNVHASGGHVEMERRAGPAEVRPLRHGLQVIDGFGRLDLDCPHELPARICRREHEIRKYLHLPYPDRDRLIFADVDGDFMLALELELQQANDTVVLELFPDRPDQNWAHWTSPDETVP
jgi:hypothetical protein